MENCFVSAIGENVNSLLSFSDFFRNR
jgi:hypothetical protein